MRASLLFLSLVLSACANQRSSPAHDPVKPLPILRTSPTDPERLLNAWNASERPEWPLQRVEVVSVDAANGWFAAIYDWDKRWWGSACIFRVQNGRITSFEEIPGLTEQAMYSIRAVTLRGFATPVVEILGKTHMGNGSIYLLELALGKPRLLLETCAVDFNQGWEVLADGVLKRNYLDLNGDGRDDLLLSGIAMIREKVRETDDSGTEFFGEGSSWPDKEPVHKAFVFNAASRAYDELVDWRLGPPWYHD